MGISSRACAVCPVAAHVVEGPCPAQPALLLDALHHPFARYACTGEGSSMGTCATLLQPPLLYLTSQLLHHMQCIPIACIFETIYCGPPVLSAFTCPSCVHSLGTAQAPLPSWLSPPLPYIKPQPHAISENPTLGSPNTKSVLQPISAPNTCYTCYSAMPCHLPAS